MIVRSLNEARKSQRRVSTDNWESVRLLLKNDDMGFSFHITTIYAGTVNEMWYKNHLESVFCMSGTGELEDLETGQVHRIEPGVIYALDKHDRHILRGITDLTLACVFNPPLNGKEVHDEDGVYRLDAEVVNG